MTLKRQIENVFEYHGRLKRVARDIRRNPELTGIITPEYLLRLRLERSPVVLERPVVTSAAYVRNGKVAFLAPPENPGVQTLLSTLGAQNFDENRVREEILDYDSLRLGKQEMESFFPNPYWNPSMRTEIVKYLSGNNDSLVEKYLSASEQTMTSSFALLLTRDVQTGLISIGPMKGMPASLINAKDIRGKNSINALSITEDLERELLSQQIRQ